MAIRSNQIIAFNRGILAKIGLARIVDIEQLSFAARAMTNWMPRVLGSMMIRPGWKYTGASKSNLTARGIPFVYADDDMARIEITNTVLRVWVDDALITRPTVTAAIANGTFDTDLASWTDNDESGGVSAWATGGYMSLIGNGTNAAIRRQEVTVNEAGTEHALRIIINRGPVLFRVGSTAGDDDYIEETALATGTHSLTFTPSGNFHIQFFARHDSSVQVDSVVVEAAGVMEVTAPWLTADLRNIRHTQSGDVVFVGCKGYHPYRIERRNSTSWSVVKELPEDGPFRVLNTGPITITPSALSGDITLTASKPLFKSTHVGALFRVQSQGQVVSEAITAEDTFTDPIRVVGIGTSRTYGITITGTWVATVTIQYSIATDAGPWTDLLSYTSNTATSYDDGQDNQVIYYRIGVKSGDFTSGTVNVQLAFASGAIQGIARLIAFTSSTVVSAVVLQNFGDTEASSDWWEGLWSDFRGYPAVPQLHEGRLVWLGKDKVVASISDAFSEFDDEFEGDAGPINRSLGEGPVDTIHWALSLARLVFGTALNSANVQPVKIEGNTIRSARSTSFDEPLTPTNFNTKDSASTGAYVDRSGQRVFELSYDFDVNDYRPQELTKLVPDLNSAGIVHMAVQIQPDIRLHCLRADGTVGIVVYDRLENVVAWINVETSGDVEDIVVLPGTGEDDVYYLVERTIDSSTVRYWEKWAQESLCTGFPAAHLSDAHLIYSGAAVTTITGLGHLEGETVTVWGWNTVTPFTNMDGDAIGRDLGTKVVSGAQITGLSAAVTDACIGIAYTADFEGAKFAELGRIKKLNQLALSLVNTHFNGLRFGPSFTSLYGLGKTQNTKTTAEHHIWDDLDTRPKGFGDGWKTDTRLCLRAASPRPCTVRAAIMDYEV